MQYPTYMVRQPSQGEQRQIVGKADNVLDDLDRQRPSHSLESCKFMSVQDVQARSE